jgi:SNF family Na+-dependent transporter
MDKNSEAILVVLFDTFVALIAGLLVIGLISHDVGKNIADNETERSEKIIQGIKKKFDESTNLGGAALLFTYLPGLF